jgi:maleamate amidohydrolase
MKKVWDDIVPKDMMELYRGVGFGNRAGFGKRPAVLVIDMVYNTVGDVPEPVLQSIKKYPHSTGEFGWAAVPKIRELVTEARAKQVPIIYTRLQRESFDRDVWRPKFSSKLSQSVISAYAPKGTEFIKEIAPLENDIIITKKRTSSFFGTPLVSYLTKFEVDTLIITGGATAACVHTTTVDANQHNYYVIIVEECVFDRHPFIHAVNLFDLDAKWADVVSLREVKDYLRSLSTDR